VLVVRLPPALEQRLDLLAKRTGRTKTFYVIELLSRHFAEMEARYLPHTEKPKGRRGKNHLVR